MTTVDDRRSIVTRAGEFQKEYAGKGIAGMMLKWMDKGSPLYRPEVLWHKTIGNTTHSPLPQLINKGIYNKIVEQDLRFYDTCKGTLQNKYNVIINSNENPSFKAESIDEKVLGEILASTDHKPYLFPENEIVSDDVPFMAIKSNAPLIVSKRTTVVVSDLNCPQRTLLSISNFWQAPIGMVLNFNVNDKTTPTRKKYTFTNNRSKRSRIYFDEGFDINDPDLLRTPPHTSPVINTESKEAIQTALLAARPDTPYQQQQRSRSKMKAKRQIDTGL
ncbi:unnamed protein product [Mytilus edulis]|uniref:Histidine N-acetyltransferase C-terminal domain-containing protein n=1 Tax=Mytilus edulis TaxID=6550 RepID=A0A8S3V6I1_MYTED|nr:unnamed protein product [Mytilus edulis]